MTRDAIIKVEGLSKRYLVGHQTAQRKGHETLRDAIVRETGSFVRKAGELLRGAQIVQGDEIEEFWALKDVNFEIKTGEIVGIIGRNGAGKSTLLKILSRITDPTEGRVSLFGRVSSLLEVGTGFHPELTGRENIYLNGAILGMSQSEIRSKFDEIVAFAEVERFLDTPVKRYSSGMYVRLAFAVAAHLEPEIMVVDEVLAVGDAEFQKKCLGKMSEVAGAGRTVLFVSHNHSAIRNLCTHAILLQNGRAGEKRDTESVLNEYSASFHKLSSMSWARPAEGERPRVHFESIRVELTGEQPMQSLECRMEINSAPGAKQVFVAVDILDDTYTGLMQALPNSRPFIGGREGTSLVNLTIDLPPLVPGVYFLDFWMGSEHAHTFDYIRGALSFEIKISPTPGRTVPHTRDHGFIVPHSRVDIRSKSETVPEGAAGIADSRKLLPLAASGSGSNKTGG